MKKYLLLSAPIIGLTFCEKAQGQISSRAFDKMMIDYYNFVLIGSQTPTTGFKVETNKPSITLKGNVFSNDIRTIVLNLEVQGGVNDGLAELFSSNDLNPYFKTGIGFNLLDKGNNAWHYSLTPTEEALTEQAINSNADLLIQQVDTFAVVKVILDDAKFLEYDFASFTKAVIAERDKSDYTLEEAVITYYDAGNKKKKEVYFNALIEKILIKYGADRALTGDLLLENFKGRLGINNSVAKSKEKLKAKGLLNDYDKIKESLLKEGKKTLNAKQSDFEIELTKFNWTWKKIRWTNITLNGVSNVFRTYNNTLLTKNNSLSAGVTISRNWLGKGKEATQFLYGRVGIAIQEVTNTIEMDKFTYRKETVIAVTPTEQLKSTNEGVAYKGIYKEGAGYDFFAEGYAVPWKREFIPGFYARLMYRHSDIWINQNKVPVELGLVWNIASSDKDAKTLLTIVPYATWSNIMQEYKEAEKIQKRSLAELFSVNIKFGVPINIGK